MRGASDMMVLVGWNVGKAFILCSPRSLHSREEGCTLSSLQAQGSVKKELGGVRGGRERARGSAAGPAWNEEGLKNGHTSSAAPTKKKSKRRGGGGG